MSARPAPGSSLPRNVRLLGWASLGNDLASEMIYPLLPEFLLAMAGGSRWMLGLIEGAADSVASVLKLLSGALSDRMSRRKGLVVTGYALAGLSRPLLAAALAPWHVLVLRLGDRTGKGIRTAPRDALIADSTPSGNRGRAFGFHRGMDHLGAALGPLAAAAFLLAFPGQIRWLFLLALVPGLAVLILLALGLREAPRDKASEATGPAARPERGFRMFLLALLVFTLGNSTDAFLLVRARELGVTTAFLPILWCVFHLAKSGGNFLGGRAVDRLGARPLLVAGWAIYAAVYAAFGLATAAWHVWVLFLAYAAFYALSEPAEKVLVARYAPKERRGSGFGWYHLVMGITTLPASLLFGVFYEKLGVLVAFSWGAGLALLASVLVLFARPPAGPGTM